MALSRISTVASLTLLLAACSATDFVPLDTWSGPGNGAVPQAELLRRRAFAARLAGEQQAQSHRAERSSDMAAESSAKRQAAQAYAPSLARPAPPINPQLLWIENNMPSCNAIR